MEIEVFMDWNVKTCGLDYLALWLDLLIAGLKRYIKIYLKKQVIYRMKNSSILKSVSAWKNWEKIQSKLIEKYEKNCNLSCLLVDLKYL
jgi:hypothetical protein